MNPQKISIRDQMKRLMRSSLIFLATALAIFATDAARAHDTWLIPNAFGIEPKTTITLDLTSGMAFPALEVAPKRERVQSAQCRLAEQTFEIADLSEGPQSLVLKSELRNPGIAAFWVQLLPKSIELKEAEVREYLEEIAAPEGILKQWAEMKEPRRWRELYAKHPKAFVRVGQPENDRSWAKPIGQELEIVPEKDPTLLRVGNSFSVQILKGGAPLKDFAVNAVAAGETKGETRKTDSQGRVVFTFDKAGPWLLRGTDVRKSTKPEADWESDFATLTVAVAPQAEGAAK